MTSPRGSLCDPPPGGGRALGTARRAQGRPCGAWVDLPGLAADAASRPPPGGGGDAAPRPLRPSPGGGAPRDGPSGAGTAVRRSRDRVLEELAHRRVNRSTGSVVRHSDTLLPPQPSSPQGRQGCAEVTTRLGTRHGPHAISDDGPKSATTGVPTADAMCIGAESTPTNRRARAVSAASSRSESIPPRSATRLAAAGESCARIASSSARSRPSGAAVSTTGRPSATMRSTSAATRSAGQHLKNQREPGWACTKAPRASPRLASSASTFVSASAPATITSLRASSGGSMPIRRSASRFCSTIGRSVARGSR